MFRNSKHCKGIVHKENLESKDSAIDSDDDIYAKSGDGSNDFQSKGRGQLKKNVFFRALPELWGGIFWPSF